MMTQTADDPTLTANPKFKSRQDEQPKTRLRRWGTECRLAEQIEAEKVLLTSDITTETRLRSQSNWSNGQEQVDGNTHSCSSQDFTIDTPRQFGTKLDIGTTNHDELDWTNTSDDDEGAHGVGSNLEDFHTVQNLEKNVSDGSTAEIPRFLARPRVSCIPPSPTNDPELSPGKNLDSSPSSSPMETDISSFFPASRTTVERSTIKVDLPAKKQGLSPRQRLLYRYQMEEMMMHESNADENTEEMQDESAGSGFLEPSTDASGLDMESGFAEPPDSPYSWKTSRSTGTDVLEEPSIYNSVTGVVRDCHICGYAPCSRADYDSHMKKTHFTHKCHLCIYWSRSPGRLNRHMKNFHSEPNDTPANKKPKNPRKYTCKQCDFFTYIQEEIWNHTRVHVPASKLLSCPHCPFVCAFKHHMQYHMNNHLGFKPFKCSECNYRCNNKSMLNSHKKSHSNDYPYCCGVCNYAAKYRHALNIHLRKKKHFADGELMVDDSHRLGRIRNRSSSTQRSQTSTERLSQMVRPFPEDVGVMWQQESQFGGTMADYDTVKQEPEIMNHSINTSSYPQTKPQSAYALPGVALQPSMIPMSDLSHVQQHLCYSPVMLPAKTTQVAQNHLPVSQIRSRLQPHGNGASSIPNISASATSLATQSHSSLYEINQQYRLLSDAGQFPARSNYQTIYPNQEQSMPVLSSPRRYSVDATQDYGSDSSDEWPLDLTAKPKESRPENRQRKASDNLTEIPRLDWYECQHCGIIFPDRILYTMHMEYHNQSDPFQCNLCGQQTKDRREFFNHISQVAHN